MPPPSFNSYGESSYVNTISGSEIISTGLSWSAGSIIIVIGITEDNSITMNTPTVSGGAFTFSLITSVLVAANCNIYAWVANPTGAGSVTTTTISVIKPVSGRAGISGWSYDNHGGLGANATINTSGNRIINLTRTGLNSAIICALGDRSANADVVLTSVPDASATQRETSTIAAVYTAAVIDWGDQGAIGADDYGYTDQTGTVVNSGIVLEILGLASSSSYTLNRRRRRMTTKRRRG